MISHLFTTVYVSFPQISAGESVFLSVSNVYTKAAVYDSSPTNPLQQET